jgi:predicted branched-subunit amino acid permease
VIERTTWRGGVRAAAPLFVPTFLLAVSFGVLARPVLGTAEAITMSAIVWAGGAQFAALGVLQAGGAAGAAIVAGILVNGRFLPMGLAIGPSLTGSARKRALKGQTLVDASFALSAREGGRFEEGILLGGAIPQYAGWFLGTVVGVLAGGLIGDVEDFGLDAIFPAFYLALLLGELRSRDAVTAALLGAAITLALMPVAPPGVPVLAASLAALLGLWSRR